MHLHEANKDKSTKQLNMSYLEIFLNLNFQIDREKLKEFFLKEYKVPSSGEPEFIIKLFTLEPKTPQELMMTGGRPYQMVGFTYHDEEFIHEAPEYLMNYLFYLISLDSPTLYPSAEEVKTKWNSIVEERDKNAEETISSMQIDTEQIKQNNTDQSFEE